MSARKASFFAAATLVAALTVVLSGCGTGEAAQPPAPPPSSEPAAGLAGGMKLAPGLYDMEDGTVQAVGTAEYRDLEGGFWVIVGGTEAEGNVGEVVAVIANGDAYAQQLEKLAGLSVIVTGTRLDGTSTRMAGPEIDASSVVAASDAPPGPAE